MAATYEWIGGLNISSSTTIATVSSISGSYTDLRVIFNSKLQTGGFENCYMWFNGQSTGSVTYSYQHIDNATSVGAGFGSTNFITVFWDSLASSFLMGIIDLYGYSDTTYYRGGTAHMFRGLNQNFNRGSFVSFRSSSNAAITSISFQPAGGDKFAAGSYINIYGIARE